MNIMGNLKILWRMALEKLNSKIMIYMKENLKKIKYLEREAISMIMEIIYIKEILKIIWKTDMEN